MHYVHKIEIEALWGSRKRVEVSFDRHVNFLIGSNGSGKTTVINLLAFLLRADHASLTKIDFQETLVTLRETARGPLTLIRARRGEGKSRGKDKYST